VGARAIKKSPRIFLFQALSLGPGATFDLVTIRGDRWLGRTALLGRGGIPRHAPYIRALLKKIVWADFF